MKKNIFLILCLLLVAFLFYTDNYTKKEQQNDLILATNAVNEEKGIFTSGPLVDSRVNIDFLRKNEDLKVSEIIEETNNQRSIFGLNKLEMNENLNSSAEVKLKDMFDNQYFEHDSPSGQGVGDLGNNAGYEFIIIGENLAMGNFANSKAVVSAWMASLGHRENILKENYEDIGVAVGEGVFENKTIWMAVQHFGRPESSCPSLDSNLYKEIQKNTQSLKDLEIILAETKSNIENSKFSLGNFTEATKAYNDLVKEFNSRLADVKRDTIRYNKQVETLNTCLAK